MSEERWDDIDRLFREGMRHEEASHSKAELDADWQSVKANLPTGGAGAGQGGAAGGASGGGFVGSSVLLPAAATLVVVAAALIATVVLFDTPDAAPAPVGEQVEVMSAPEQPLQVQPEELEALVEEQANPSVQPELQEGESSSPKESRPAQITALREQAQPQQAEPPIADAAPARSASGQPKVPQPTTAHAGVAAKEEHPQGLSSLPEVTLSAQDVCVGESVVLQVSGNENWRVQCQTAAGSSADCESLPTEEAGVKHVEVILLNGETRKVLPLSYTVHPQVEADFTVSLQYDPQVHFQNQSTGATGYRWTFGDDDVSEEKNPLHTYAEEGLYAVTMEAFNKGCDAQATLQVPISVSPDVNVPNVFTPNGDGANDEFLVEVEGETYFEITVMSRQGQIVFHSLNKGNHWNGQLPSGQAAPEGQYFFVLKYQLAGQPMQKKTDYLLLKRE